MDNRFHAGDRIRISEDYHWAKGASGTVRQPLPFVRDLVQGSEGWQGVSRVVNSLLGPLTFYWVEFDTPQPDADGDGPYDGGEIDARYLLPLGDRLAEAP